MASHLARPAVSSARSPSPSTTTATMQQQVHDASWHRLMWIPLLLLAPATVVCVQYIAQTVRSRQAHMAANAELYTGWTYPQLSDLMVTLYSLMVLLTLRVTLCRFVFHPLGDWILPTLQEKKGKWTAAAREDRVQRFSVCVFKLCYFTIMTAYGYSTLKNVDFLPPVLGGKGALEGIWAGWPYSPVTAAVKQYYLVELSYHAHSLVFHLFTTHRNDFIEMTLHHTCAILLVLFSYFANFVRIGVLVLFLHDIADVSAYAVKAVVDTKYTALTLTAYASLLVSWGYTRLYVFPVHVIASMSIPRSAETDDGTYGLVWYTSYFMIWLLQALHVYWYTLFLIMGYRFLLSGKTMDIQQKAGEQDGSYVDYHKKHIKQEQEERNGKHARKEEAPQSPTLTGAEDEDELQGGAVKPQPIRTRSAKAKSRRAD